MSLISKAASCIEIRHIHIFQIASFIATCQELLPVIEQAWRERGNSDSLPVDVVTYLCRRLRIDFSDIQSCWVLFKEEIRHPCSEDDSYRDLMAHTYSLYSSIVELRKLGLGEMGTHSQLESAQSRIWNLFSCLDSRYPACLDSVSYGWL